MDRHYLFFRKKNISNFLGSNQRYHRLYKFLLNDKGEKPSISCFNGRHKYFYKYTT